MKMKTLALALTLTACMTASRAEERTFPIPGEGWRVVVDVPPLTKIEEPRRGVDYTLKAQSGRFNLSLFVERPQSAQGSHKECYEFYWAQSRRNPAIDQQSVRVTPGGRYYRVEYVISIPFQGKRLKHKNVNYYFVFNRRWVDLHISFLEPNARDEEVFRRFDRGFRCEMIAGGNAATATAVVGNGRLLAGNKVERTYPIPGGGTLVLAVPAAWKGGVAQARDAKPDMLTVEFTRDNANGFEVSLTLLPKTVSLDARKPVGPQLRGYLEAGRRTMQASAEEKELPVNEFREGEVVGCYFTATDRTVPRHNPPAGQAKYMLQATMLISNRCAILTALSNTPGNADQSAALEVVKTARCR